MRSVAYSLGWNVVQRHRLGLSLFAGGMAALVGLRQLPGVPSGAVVGGSIWLLFGLLYVVAIFTQPEADITAPGSGYPNHLFVLPVRTRELVLWPMLYGGAILAAGWVVVAGLVMNQPPTVAPILWPACMLPAVLASLQALFWTPMRFPLARVMIALVLLASLIYFGAGNPLGFAGWALAVVYLGVIAVAYTVAVSGVALARRSAQTVRSPREASVSRQVRLKPGFNSPERAQFWYEWRRGGIVFPIVALVVCLLASVPLTLEHTPTSPFRDWPISPNVYLAVYLGGLLRAIPFIAWILGGAVWISGARASALSIPAFIAMRPLSSAAMAFARLKSRLFGAAVAFTILFVCIFVWLMLPATLLDVSSVQPTSAHPLLGMLVRFSAPRELAVAAVYVLLLFGITLRNLVVGQFASLSGRPAIAYAYMAAVYAGPVMALSLLGAAHTGVNQSDWYLVFGIAILVKAVAAQAVISALYRRRLLSVRDLLIMVGVWCLTAFGFFEAFKFVVSGGSRQDLARLIGYIDLQHSATPGMLLLMAIFWTPFVRLAAAPLMLETNRRGAT